MIEQIVETACIECGVCVKTCPNDVFEAVDDAPPVIARQADCHTCYLCEAYCPVDALYVSPLARPDPSSSLQAVVKDGHLGDYRRAIGWINGRPAAA